VRSSPPPLDRHARRRRAGGAGALIGPGSCAGSSADGADPARLGDPAAQRLARHPFRAARVRQWPPTGHSPPRLCRPPSRGWEPSALLPSWRSRSGAPPTSDSAWVLGRDLPLARSGPSHWDSGRRPGAGGRGGGCTAAYFVGSAIGRHPFSTRSRRASRWRVRWRGRWLGARRSARRPWLIGISVPSVPASAP